MWWLAASEAAKSPKARGVVIFMIVAVTIVSLLLLWALMPKFKFKNKTYGE